MIKKLIFKNVYIFPISLLLFLLDVSTFTLLGTHTFCLLLCFYTTILFIDKISYQLILIMIPLSYQSFIFYGNGALFLAYILPVSIVALKARKVIHRRSVLPYLTITTMLLIQQCIIEPKIFDSHIVWGCTIKRICVSLLVVAMFLKYLPKGKQGDRL